VGASAMILLRLPRRAALIVLVSSRILLAQDLAPRAYVITPVRSNAVTLTWGFYNGGLNLNGAIPVTVNGTYHVPILSYYRSFGFFGRSANVAVSLPYGIGNFEGMAPGRRRSAYRSGLFDSTLRFSVNLKGGPAMPIEKFGKWKQKTIIGASLRVIAPTGQYRPTQFINWGIHRWALKPELGCSKRWNNWLLDGYAGAWLYTANPASFRLPAPVPQTEQPIGSLEGHWSRDFGRGTWVSFDGNFWWGGTTTLAGVQNPATHQTSSRLGATAAVRLSQHQSLKFTYSNGVYVRFGGNYQNVSVAWQYSWLDKP
jgi:hypothetical protein